MLWNAVFLLVISAAHAQTSSSISGTVHDAADALVPGAKVTLINEASKGTRVTTSNAEGFFYFAAVQPGTTYSIQITMAGFESWKVTGIEVHPGDSLTVPKIRLKIGQVMISVVVTAEGAGVTLSSGEHSTLITAADINRLSTTGRDAAELMSILPGFTLNAGTNVQNQGPDYTTMGFGSGNVGAYGANGAAPQQGMVNITADGANVIDPGDMGGQVSNVNMDQVQEVKVQTSNFGADEAKGPIVINAVGKSGGDAFHGGVYVYFRNAALNSNDWLSNYYGTPRAESRYFYPGATIGGPVKIPGTHFNEKKHLVFWAGFEYYGQDNVNALATAFVPNAAMLGGDLSTDTIAKALNLSPTDLVAGCPNDNASPTFTNIAGLCWSPNGSLDQTGTIVNNGQLKNIDPATTTFTNLYPKINRVPQPVITNGTTQFASDGINYTQNVMATHNGFQFHTRIDENISETLKLYGTYNWEKVNDQSPMNNMYYNPNGTVPFPTPLDSNGFAHYLTLNLTKTFGSSMTNELVGSGVYFDQPEQFADRAKALDTGTPWAAAGYSGGALKNGVKQLPEIIGYETVSTPSFAMGNVPPTSWYLKKTSWNVADNLTKQYRTHSIKVGVYVEQTTNNQVTAGSTANGQLTFMRWDTCYQNQTTKMPGPPATKAGLGNVIGNFLIGCPLGYSQANFDPSNDLRFRTFEGYATDEWKVNSKLTLTLGIRLTHLTPWTDAHGIGMAVWDPSQVPQNVLNPQGIVGTNPSTWPGIFWHTQNSNIPIAGVPTRELFYSPRFGLAYDLYDNGKTVFRGGWGVYHSHDPFNNPAGAASTGVGLQTYSNPSTISCTFGQLFTTSYVPCGAYAASSTGSVTPFSVYALDPKDDHEPVTYNYNFTLDQQGPWHSSFEIAYTGNQSSSLPTLGNLQNQNVIPLNAFFGPDPVTGSVNPPSDIPNSADYRPYPNYQQVYVETHINWANYNALQASWNKQRGSLVYGANYTWSKALGVRGNYDTGYIGDPVNPHHDYGIVGFDRPQALNLSYSWQEGTKFNGNHVLGQVVNGWELSGITSLQSGPDLAVVNGSTNFGLSGGVNYNVGSASISFPLSAAEWLGSSDYTLQPVVTCDPRLGLKKDQFVNGNCFAMPPVGAQGQWNLPDVHGPAYSKSDLSVYKDFKLNDRQNMQFRLSGFNFLNHPITSFNNNNLGSLNLVASDCPSTGTCPTYTTPSQALAAVQITNAATFGSTAFKFGQRIVELGFKYNF
jgi:hypothetical protein